MPETKNERILPGVVHESPSSDASIIQRLKSLIANLEATNGVVITVKKEDIVAEQVIDVTGDNLLKPKVVGDLKPLDSGTSDSDQVKPLRLGDYKQNPSGACRQIAHIRAGMKKVA